MADNLTTQSGTPATVPASSVISTEEVTNLNGGAVSAQHLQRVATAIRTADGTAVDLPGSTADGLLVNLGANNDVVDAAVEASLAIMDDWDETDRCKVNIIAGQAGITAGAGAVAANTPRVTHASDDPAVTHLATIAADTTDIETAVELLDDTVFADDAAFTVATSKVIAVGMLADETTPDSVDEGDVGIPRMTLSRKALSVISDPSAERHATVRDTGTNDSLNVAIVDASGNQITSFGGSGGTAMVDDAAFTPGTTNITPIGAMFDDATPDSVNEGDGGVVRMSANRNLYSTIRDAAGNERGANVDSGNNLMVNLGVRLDATNDAIAIGDGAVLADVLDLTNNNGLAVCILDGTGAQITSFGGGTQYTEADTDASITGTAMMMEGATNTLVPAQGTVADGLLVNLGANNDVTVSGVSTAANQSTIITAVQLLDDTVTTLGTDTYTEATSKGITIGAVRRDADTSLVGTTNEFGPLQMDALGRLKVEAFSGETLPVSLASVPSHAVTNAGTFAVQESGAALTALQLLDDTILADDSAFTVGSTRVNIAGFFADETATDSVDEGDTGASRMTLDRKLIVTQQGHAAGGLTIFRSLDLDETEEEVKATAGCVYGCWFTNTATATRFLKFYNATAANVTVGTTTPVITIGLPGNATDDISGALNNGGIGIGFDTAITVAATTGAADNDTGAPATGDVIVNVFRA